MIKMVYCTCNVSKLEELMKVLDDEPVESYQVFDEVRAKSVKGDPRLNNAVWPGHNASVMMQISDNDKVRNIARAVREINNSAINDNELITFASWTLEEYFFE